ncbi:MAG: NAD(P)(+) transhydrogenase (Re/Si-specific) subunit beta, partial [Ancrocorticia sp.]
MNLLPGPITALGYLIAAVCFILAIKGLSSPRTARRGNAIGAIGAALAVLIVLLSTDFEGSNLWIVLVTIAVGSAISVPVARRVALTNMPQLVALFNGIGGGAAALVGVIELAGLAAQADAGTSANEVATAVGIAIGALTFTGSIVTFLKLQGWITARPLVVPGARIWFIATVALTIGFAIAVAVSGQVWLGIVTLVAAAAFGVLLVLPVGGADVPIVISLLNATTGLAVIATGWAVDNVLLLVGGTLIGAAGTMLTLAMAKGMGRPVAGIL